MNLLDPVVAWLTARRPFFTKGIGDRQLLRWALAPIEPETPQPIAPEWQPEVTHRSGVRARGRFRSPFAEGLPEESRTALVELVAPTTELERHTVCLHLAASGDHGFERRRRLFATPLLERGLASVILENPFFGARRPSGQHGTALRTLSDLAVMGRATVSEALALLGWLRELGVERIGVVGVSMGGQMAALAASSAPFPVAAVPCIPSRTPAEVFTEGLLSRAVDWHALMRDLGAEARTRVRAELERGDVLAASPPIRPDAAVLVAARHDRFVRPRSAEEIHHHWPGSELRLLEAGHVGTVLCHGTALRRAVIDALDRL
jgi:pimeloyl-ACP methyl ester carboxylesterase